MRFSRSISLAYRFRRFSFCGAACVFSASRFSGVCLLRLRQQKAFVGVGMLSLGFLLWVIYIGSYPFPREFGSLYSAGFFVAALLQLFIAISMIVLLFQEIQRDAQKARAEIKAVRLEKEALLSKVMSTRETCQNLYNRIRATEETGKALLDRHRTQRAVADQEQLQAL